MKLNSVFHQSPVVTHGHERINVNATFVGSIPTRRHINILYFHFPCFGVGDKRGVEFRPLTRSECKNVINIDNKI